MTAFFIPGIDGNGRSSEDTYGKLRKEIQLDLGRLPRGQRIFRLWSRRGGVDCITQVGRPDPLRGGTVIAIFDMGPHDCLSSAASNSPAAETGSGRSSGATPTRYWRSTNNLKVEEPLNGEVGRLQRHPRPTRT